MATVLVIGGPTAVIELTGLRLLTDPTFDPPGSQSRGLVKTAGPALDADSIGHIDAVLLSHDQHPDNLDGAGRDLLERAPRTLTTVAAAERLGGNAIGLEPWTSFDLPRVGGAAVTVTAVPAQHGPDGSDPVMGPVIGFVLTGDDVGTLYVSGDNASLDVVRRIADRLGPIEVAILFAGGASLPSRFDGAYLTLSSKDAAAAARVLGSRAIVPLHFDGWAHFTDGADTLIEEFEAAGLGDRLALGLPGTSVTV